MRNPTRILAAIILSALAALAASTAAFGQAQQSIGALERGYRTGYSDGYQGGYGDSTQHLARDYKNKDEYQRADRAYASSYGALEDYRDGYQQGFEAGYDAGFDHRSFDSTIPANLSRRGTTDDSQSSGTPIPNDNGNSSSSSSSGTINTGNTGNTSNTGNAGYIPADTVLRVELLTNLSTDATQKGDRFQARVIEPADYQGAMIEGHVSRVKRPGKLKGNAELQLSFDQISLNGRWTNFTAQVIEVESTGTSEGVGDVDQEGGVKGKDRTKDDISKVGASTGVGAILGAILGGGKGAAIGAAIGGAVGAGSVITSSGRDIRLEHGQQLKIRTSRETTF
jgi:outer membrane lipoprotein SlyB